MADPKQSGVGGFGDLGTHKLDISDVAHWGCGSGDRGYQGGNRAVMAIATNAAKGSLHFKNGVTGTLAAGWVDIEDPVQLIISGTEGRASIVKGLLYYKAEHVAGMDGREPVKQLPAGPALPMHQFLDAVAGDKTQPLVTPREAAARVSVMEAMYKGGSRSGHGRIRPKHSNRYSYESIRSVQLSLFFFLAGLHSAGTPWKASSDCKKLRHRCSPLKWIIPPRRSARSLRIRPMVIVEEW